MKLQRIFKENRVMKEYSTDPLLSKEKIEDTISYKASHTFKTKDGEDLEDHYECIMKKYNLKKTDDTTKSNADATAATSQTKDVVDAPATKSEN